MIYSFFFFWLTLFALPNCLSTDRESDKLLCTRSGPSIKSHCLFASQILPLFAFWIHLLVQLPKDAAVSLYYRNCRESFSLDLLTEILDSSLPPSLLCGYTVWTSRTSRDKRHQRALNGASPLHPDRTKTKSQHTQRCPFTPPPPPSRAEAKSSRLTRVLLSDSSSMDWEPPALLECPENTSRQRAQTSAHNGTICLALL